MQSHVLSFSRWVSGESWVCDVLGLCLCIVLVVSTSGCLKSLICYCTVLTQSSSFLLDKHKPTAVPVKALKINKTYVRVAKGDSFTHKHVQKPTLATEV